MFSYEERIKAVLLYIKYNRKAAAVVRDLGYPTTRTLRTWYQEYTITGDLHRSTVRTSKFTVEQKRLAVDYYLEHGRCMASTIRALGYPCIETLRLWIHNRCPNTRSASIHHRRHKSFSGDEKKQAVVELCVREGSAAAVAKKVGVSRACLYEWRQQLLGDMAVAMKKTPKKQPKSEDCINFDKELKNLQERVYQLQLEHDILVKANDLLVKNQGINLTDLANREKTLLIDALKATYKVTELLNILAIPRSSYFYHSARLQCPVRHHEIRKDVVRIFRENRRVYGYRRIHAMLQRNGSVISEKVVRRIMVEEQLVVTSKRRRRYSAYNGEITPAVENIVHRDFQAEAPAEKWLTDITEFQIPAGKVYLSPMIDCFDGTVVSWTISTGPDAEMVNSMLDIAITTLKPDEYPIVHTDRGAHYRWPGWIERMKNAGLTRSMSKKACTADNAACEGFFGRLKTEMFYNRCWKGVTIEQFIKLVNEYIRWYNEKRIKLSLGGLSPIEYRESLGLVS